MSECIIPKGYHRPDGYVVRSRRGASPLRLHREAWEKVHGPVPDGMFVCHSCDNRACCNVEHLFLGTHLDNMADMRSKERSVRGSKNGSAKLTEETAIYAMARLLAGEQQGGVAKAFGVSRPAINLLWNGKRWGHLFQERV